LLDEVVIGCSDEAEARSIILEVNCDEPLTCFGSKHLLEQAVSNLVVNAIRYGPSSSTVRLAACAVESKLQITVADEGPGIDESSCRRLFERFFRVDRGRSREVGGTGLGLAIVKHIAQAHGGSVEVESTPGEGSIFTVSLPSSSEHNLNSLPIES
jgi:two-component system phosphate regulon sensor histidine kinase PhoR